MGTLRHFSMLAALSLAAGAYAQTQATQDPTDSQSTAPSSQSPSSSQSYPSSQSSQTSQDTNPNAASSPHQRDVTSQSTTEAPANANPDPSAASSPHQQGATRMAEAGRTGNVSSGMDVQTQSGEQLGTVVDIIPGSTGEAGYVVIATAGGKATPVPYSTASSMVYNNKLVMDKSRLEKAPKVKQGEDRSSKAWQKKADSYWGKGSSSSSDSDRMQSDQGQMKSDQDRSMNSDQTTTPRQPQ